MASSEKPLLPAYLFLGDDKLKRDALLAQNQKEPAVEEIARELDIPPADVVMALDAMSDPVSLFDPVYGEAGETLNVMDKICDNKNTDTAWLEHIALSEAVEKLGDRERRILAMRFFDGRTQMEVAAEIGISQAQVSRLEKNAIGQIKKQIGAS